MTVGLPWPQGAVHKEQLFRLIGPDGSSLPLQTRVLDRWPDGSVRWCLFEFAASWDGVSSETGYRISVGKEERVKVPFTSPIEIQVTDTHNLKIICGSQHHELRLQVRFWNETGADPGRFHVGPRPIESDSLHEHFLVHNYAPLKIDLIAHRLVNTPVLRFQLTIQNPSASDHPGGNWDLGNHGSVYLRDCVLSLENPHGSVNVRCSDQRNQLFTHGAAVEYLQASSGGRHWNGKNHLTRAHKVELPFSGYSKCLDGENHNGDRATPIVVLENESGLLGATMPAFWENFPKAIEASGSRLKLALFPEQPYAHEIQGGEQKTHTFYLAFDRDTVSDQPLVWCRSPIICHADPEWYSQSGVLPYLTPRSTDSHTEYLALVDLALEGKDTFLHKREQIDEYGWRHFGDIYGDHEAVYHKGPSPMVSHYNNQYDCVAAFLIQFFRSGDVRWLTQGLECADHTVDIDIYHTDQDKAAYNRGLFWHTYHYAEADTGTHRSYPRSLTFGPVESLTQKMDQLGETAKQLKKSYAVGGGPASSHNYNAGLMFAYYLTGNKQYRDAAVDLAQFVIAMEDPSKTPFRFLSSEHTGLATESGGGGYHGPGRAAANSILALLVGHQLTQDQVYLDKAEQLIRRVVHPKQNLERLDLLNAELRWFYTMTLQALGRYLDYKAERGELDRMYAYARLTLLHYARWMATHERPILDTPEKLQYPTETWAAQDMRKVEVFQYAARHAVGDERDHFRERAKWFFDYVTRKLGEFPTKSLCRPVILMMKYGWTRNWWNQLQSTKPAPEPLAKVTADDFGSWQMFVPQKAIAMKRAKRIVVLGGAAGFLLIASLAWYLLR